MREPLQKNSKNEPLFFSTIKRKKNDQKSLPTYFEWYQKSPSKYPFQIINQSIEMLSRDGLIFSKPQSHKNPVL